MKFFRTFVVLAILVLSGAYTAHASATLGTIDPRGVGNWKALFENSGLASSPTLNFGKFTTQAAYNITVSDTELRGYAWGEGVGWIVTNCADTTSGCSSTNGNFKVANDGSGLLSGYAWGENTGWINFGPFTNTSISRVKITNGLFGGSLGNAGYAWAQNYGWIRFDCSSPASCVETDWGVTTTTPPGGGGGGNGGWTQCADSKENDGDGLIDSQDPGCHTDGNAANPASYDRSDNDERDVAPACSDGTDNDLDGAIDYPNDPGCTSPSGTDESDGITLGYCQQNPDASECQGYICSDGKDNDGDGLTDYPNDPGCQSVFDQDETDPIIPYCQAHPSDPSCQGGGGETTPPSFCQLNPLDPICTGGGTNTGGGDTGGGTTPACEQFPFLPGCTTPDTTSAAAVNTPTTRFLGIAGLGLPFLTAVVSYFISNPVAIKDIPLLVMQLWNGILMALGWKKRRKPWGVVYDSITKRPIDPAYVVLMDMQGNEVATAITDINGRYGFAVDPGTYKIVANKTNYQFPSNRLQGKQSDGLYDQLYFGEEVVVSKEGEIITKNIPLDQLAFDWNEYTKQMGGTYGMKLTIARHTDVILYHVSRILFVLGFAYSVYAYILSPIVYNQIILVLYTVMAIAQALTRTFHKKGAVLSKFSKKPLPYSVVRIISAVTNQEVAHKVADRFGNYYGLVPNGLYTFAVDTKKLDDPEAYDKHPVDKYVKIKKGYLKETFKV